MGLEIILFTLLYFSVLIVLAGKFKNQKPILFFMAVGVMHFAMTIFYHFYSLTNIADATWYYASSKETSNWSDLLGTDTKFIRFFLYPFVKYLDFNYFLAFLPFTLLSLIGYFLILKILVSRRENEINKFYYILLLPQLHFWTCAIGKDSLIFLGICLLTYSISQQKIRWFSFVCSLAIIALIRFHVFAFLFVGLSIYFIFIENKKVIYKVILAPVFLGLVILLTPLFAEKVGLNDDLDIGEYTEKALSYNQGEGSSVDMSNTSFIVKMFSYIGRPFFFDAKSILHLEASFENIIWVYMFFTAIFGILRKRKEQNKKTILLFILFFTILFPLSFLLNNLGIAMRQKTMFFPFLFLLFLTFKYPLKNNSNNLSTGEKSY